MEFKKENLVLLKRQLNAAIQEVAEKNGLEISLGALNYIPNEESFTMTLKGATSNTAERIWMHHCRKFNLEPSHFNSMVQIKNQKLRAVGLSIRSTKRPVIVEDIDSGQQYKISHTYFLSLSTF